MPGSHLATFPLTLANGHCDTLRHHQIETHVDVGDSCIEHGNMRHRGAVPADIRDSVEYHSEELVVLSGTSARLASSQPPAAMTRSGLMGRW